VQRHAGVAGKVAPVAEIPQDEQFALLAIPVEPGAVGRIERRLGADRRGPPVGEILGELLPADDDLVRKIARLVLAAAARAKLGVVIVARDRQVSQRQDAGNGAVVGQKNVMRGIAGSVVRVARVLVAVGLSAGGMISTACGCAGRPGSPRNTAAADMNSWPVAPQA
jgi:hypothetical protein